MRARCHLFENGTLPSNGIGRGAPISLLGRVLYTRVGVTTAPSEILVSPPPLAAALPEPQRLNAGTPDGLAEHATKTYRATCARERTRPTIELARPTRFQHGCFKT